MARRSFRRELGSDREFGIDNPTRRERLHRRAEVLDVEVPVGVGRQLHVLVTKDLLHAMEVDARTEQQRCGRVADVVEAHLPEHGVRPEFHLADGALAQLAVGVAFDVR